MKTNERKIEKIVEYLVNNYPNVWIQFEKTELTIKFLNFKYSFLFIFTRSYVKNTPTEQIINYVTGYIKERSGKVVENLLGVMGDKQEIIYKGKNVCQRLDQM